MADDAKWKRRFVLFMAARLFGLLTFIAGIAVFYSDILRPGGWPMAGAVLIVLGLVDAVVAPNMLKKQWKREDQDGPANK
jgi:hypothetical protein